MAWDPGTYDRFRAQRARPAQDLVAALPPVTPGQVLDLGCGGGALARSLAERWPAAAVAGIDASPAMLAQAAAVPSRVRWIQADLNGWSPEAPPDLVVSNAALHWLPDHGTLFPRMMGWLPPGGVLAVQMPRNFAAPSHQAVRTVAEDPRWRDRLAGEFGGPAPVHAPEFYYDTLAPLARRLEIWETEYLQVLEGEDAVLTWMLGTTLVPVQEALAPAEFEAFTTLLRARLRAAYPQRPDGTTLFPFRRLFLIAAA
ncbi:methyltransferase domain-containing protein [Arenibaculum pallidiluteum]|uniref:methyltransferase domain-containing protein n=1 Tax=Arenibaculum pallidiluteum TaxID=2812559 RepID=UPI001A97A60C|nr:methyltransferase domain-containing protein [Arenibaculum pallidiluteum]